MPRNDALKTQLRAAIQPTVDTLVDELTAQLSSILSQRLGELVGGALGAAAGRARAGEARTRAGAPSQARRRGSAQRDMTCLAPGCGRRSKGPRFRFLCEQHVGATTKDVTAWRAARLKAPAAKTGGNGGQAARTNGNGSTQRTAKARTAGRTASRRS